MVFGSQKNSGLYGLKTAVRDEGALSERMRLQHIKEQRERAEHDRAKTSLVEKRRLLDRNKIEISHRETEIRRLNAEVTRAESLVRVMKDDMKSFDEHISQLKKKYADALFQMDEHKKNLDIKRSEIDRENRNLHLYEQEIKALELKQVREKEAIRDIDQHIEKLGVQLAHLTNDAGKIQTEVSHASNNKMYKEKELAARERTYTVLSNKKEHEQSEVDRLRAENKRLEEEIKKLEHESTSQGAHF